MTPPRNRLNRYLIGALIRWGQHLPDRTYVELMFWLKMGRRLNLDKPTLFNDKIQWIKLYDHNPNYPIYADKYAVKEFVEKKIVKEFIIPTLGVWDSIEEIDWDNLPNQFVIKTTIGGGGDGVVICKDKSQISIEEIKDKLLRGSKVDLYKRYKEWVYKDIPKRFIAEQYMQNGQDAVLTDYKFSCFNGNVHDVMVCLDRSGIDTKFYFFDRDWNLLRINKMGKEAPADFTVEKPTCMDEMFELAAKLSEGITYARVDLYSINNHPYFGEITLLPNSGYGRNFLLETERLYGDLMQLPPKTK